MTIDAMTHLTHPRPTVVGHVAASFDVAFCHMTHFSHSEHAPVRERKIAYLKMCSGCENLSPSWACVFGGKSGITHFISLKPDPVMTHLGGSSVDQVGQRRSTSIGVIMKIWSIDIGTRMGWGRLEGEMAIEAGSWDLSGDRFDGFGMRPLRAKLRLTAMLEAHGRPDFVAIELPRRHAGTEAAHVYGALSGSVTEWCEAQQIPYRAVEVGRAKLELAGIGNADKAAMLAAVKRTWGIDLAGDEDAADALGIGLAAWREETGQRTETAAERARREAAERKAAKAAERETNPKGARRARKEAV